MEVIDGSHHLDKETFVTKASYQFLSTSYIGSQMERSSFPFLGMRFEEMERSAKQILPNQLAKLVQFPVVAITRAGYYSV